MRYLLDTHTLIWYSKNADELPHTVRNELINPRNILYVSSASFWEMTIKAGINKLDISLKKLYKHVEMAGILILQIEQDYLYKQLELPPIHKDPFDRLLIATAQAEKLTIITVDENIHRYDVSWVW
ncbi:MAG: type II toxin-antitoxin system VapC family toxin [Defluviitaleaceae bacterium]|nr:type II toxin-antitoxin system VapC family toxin [Defluviitaleaceae bacterium]